MLNHDTAAHSLICPISRDLLDQNKLLNQQVVALNQQVVALKKRVGLLAEQIDEHDGQIGYTVRRLKQYEPVMDAYENRYHEWECSPHYDSLDGDANCNY